MKPDIDPQIQIAADELKDAYTRLQQSQDPLVKKVDKQKVFDALDAATVTTIAVEQKNLTKKSIPNRN